MYLLLYSIQLYGYAKFLKSSSTFDGHLDCFPVISGYYEWYRYGHSRLSFGEHADPFLLDTR